MDSSAPGDASSTGAAAAGADESWWVPLLEVEVEGGAPLLAVTGKGAVAKEDVWYCVADSPPSRSFLSNTTIRRQPAPDKRRREENHLHAKPVGPCVFRSPTIHVQPNSFCGVEALY